MPSWQYRSKKELEETSPSLKLGITTDNEKKLRWQYCEFLKEAGIDLKVPQLTLATATVFCHRFFAHRAHSIKKGPFENDHMVIAAACLFLAGKVEETPKQLKDVVFVAYKLRRKRSSERERLAIHHSKEMYEEEREKLLQAERRLLYTLGFEFEVEHPYKHLLEAVRNKFTFTEESDPQKVKAEKSQIAQLAWYFVNDSLRTSLCLQYEPKKIAVAAIFLAAKYQKVLLESCKSGSAWWEDCAVGRSDIEDINSQILDLYTESKGAEKTAPFADQAGSQRQGESAPSSSNEQGKTDMGVTNSAKQGSMPYAMKAEGAFPNGEVSQRFPVNVEEKNSSGPPSLDGSSMRPLRHDGARGEVGQMEGEPSMASGYGHQEEAGKGPLSDRNGSGRAHSKGAETGRWTAQASRDSNSAWGRERGFPLPPRHGPDYPRNSEHHERYDDRRRSRNEEEDRGRGGGSWGGHPDRSWGGHVDPERKRPREEAYIGGQGRSGYKVGKH